MICLGINLGERWNSWDPQPGYPRDGTPQMKGSGAKMSQQPRAEPMSKSFASWVTARGQGVKILEKSWHIFGE